jgi:hypothetical protein
MGESLTLFLLLPALLFIWDYRILPGIKPLFELYRIRFAGALEWIGLKFSDFAPAMICFGDRSTIRFCIFSLCCAITYDIAVGLGNSDIQCGFNGSV